MAAPRPTERPRPTLLLLAAAAFTLLTLHIRGAAPLDAFQQGLRDILEPLRSVTDTATDPIQAVWNGIFGYEDLRAENERLAVELARLRGRSVTDAAGVTTEVLIDNTAVVFPIVAGLCLASALVAQLIRR